MRYCVASCIIIWDEETRSIYWLGFRTPGRNTDTRGPRLLDSSEPERAPPRKAVAGVERRRPRAPNLPGLSDPRRATEIRTAYPFSQQFC